MHLVGVFGRNCRYQVIVIFVVRVSCDGGQRALGQVNVVEVARLEVLERNIGGLHHLNGNGVEQFALGIPVERVLGENFLVTLNVGGHGVWTIVPHVLVVHRLNRVWAAQLIDHCLGNWVQALVNCQGIKVWFFSDAGVGDGVIIRHIDTDHLAERRAFLRSQRQRFFFTQGLGVFIVFVCTLEHFQRHGSVGGIVFIEIQNPFHTGGKIVSGAVRFLVAVDVYPFYALAQFEGPGFAAIFAAPFLCNSWLKRTFRGRFQQAVDQVGQVLTVLLSLAVKDVKGFQLTGQQPWNIQVGDFALCCFCRTSCAAVFAFRCSSAAAACQNKCCCQRQSKQSGDCLFHIISSLTTGHEIYSEIFQKNWRISHLFLISPRHPHSSAFLFADQAESRLPFMFVFSIFSHFSERLTLLYQKRKQVVNMHYFLYDTPSFLCSFIMQFVQSLSKYD